MPFAQEFLRPYARLATTNRLMLYGALSTLAVSIVIFNAFQTYSNFYAVAVHLSRSSRSVMVLANFGILCSILAGHFVQQIFFGSLRTSEVERLYDKIWFFLTESLLAFTIFRDEFDATFAVMFGFLLFVKCFHWLMSFRIEWMDQVQYPGPNFWFHIRINVLFFFLWLIDVTVVCLSIESIMSNGIGAVVLFTSEYSILLASAFNSICKYLIIWYDTRRAASRGGENAPIWEDKSMYIFYVELATDFLKLITYMAFFLTVLAFYGLPLNSLRDIYITARSFFQRCRDLIRYRTATRNMDERYPNATEAELTQLSDRTCIICREEMQHREPAPPNGSAGAQPNPAAGAAHRPTGVNDTPKKLPCGHVFHFHCLRSWLERQQSCPTCRRTVLETRPANGPGIGAGAAQGGPGVNMPAPGGALQPNGNIDGAQPQGFLARWFRGAGLAAPIVPGQFAAGPMADNQGPAQIQGQLQQPLQPFQQQQHQQQPFGFPNPFGPWLQPPFPPGMPQNAQYQQPPQQPAPVQVLQGFYIGNQWQPWGQEPPQQQQQQQQQPFQPQPQPQSPPQQPYPVQTQSPTPTPTVPTSSNTDFITSSSTTSRPEEPPVASSSTPAPTPREAAALAALRRLGSSGTSVNSNSGSSQSQNKLSSPTSELTGRSGSSNLATASGSSNANQNNTVPSPSIPPTNSSSTVAGGAQPSHPPYRNTLAPSLIPLFDPATTSATIVPPPQGNISIPSSSNFQSYLRSPGALIPNSASQLRPSDDMSYNDLRDLLRSPSLLSVTEEDLAKLDTLTRESIDERLRILEEVQGVMWRCSEELVRVRSMLPPARRENNGRNVGTSSSATATAAGSSIGSGLSNSKSSPTDANAAAGNSHLPSISKVGSSKPAEPLPPDTSTSVEAVSNRDTHVRAGKEPERGEQIQE